MSADAINTAVEVARAQLRAYKTGTVEEPAAPVRDDAAAHTKIVRSADDVPVEVWETWAQLDGERIEMEMEDVPLDQVVTSNDPDTFEVNPEYPGWLQPRDRTRAANVVQVRTMAAALD
ncbi:MAG TPA: hypothetical protein EYP56_07045, partial [Planctomycetaceae bacterium]|nr:hypothetical protein [Planctomycetaceae bacterium]